MEAFLFAGGVCMNYYEVDEDSIFGTTESVFMRIADDLQGIVASYFDDEEVLDRLIEDKNEHLETVLNRAVEGFEATFQTLSHLDYQKMTDSKNQSVTN